MSTQILNALPENRQSAFAQPFYTAARQGAKSPRDVLSAVLAKAVEMVAAGDRDRGAEILQVVGNAPMDAMDFGKYVLEREALPAEQKKQEKAQRQAHYAAQKMIEPPTEKQLWRLEHEGYRGPAPKTKGQAWQLIDQLIRQKGQAK